MVLTAKAVRIFFLNPLSFMLCSAGYNLLNFTHAEINQSTRTVFFVNTTFSIRNKAFRT
jgi:hypothetical protein